MGRWPLKGRLEEVEWWDHAGGSGWHDPSSRRAELLLCRSVGYLVSENARAVRIAQNMSDSEQVDHVMNIAKKLIRSRRVLRRSTA